MAKKLTKKATKTLKNMATKTTKVATKGRVITVKNAQGDPDTTATILVQNKINYTPKVSVIIPVYNVEQYLRECLDSVCNQTLKEIEIICVDDGSTDSSLDILKEYAQKDNRITVIAQENLHAGVARNAGLSVAKGEYLSFLDSDDFFELNMFEEMYKSATAEKSDICICHVKIQDMAKNDSIYDCQWGLKDEKLPSNIFSAKDIYENLYQFNQGWAWDKLYDRNFVLKNKVRFQSQRSSNDVYFTFCNLSVANKILCIPGKYVIHRLHVKGSLENSREKSYANICFAVMKIKEFLENNKLYDKVKLSFVNYAIGNILWNYNTLKEPTKTFLLSYIHKFYTSLFSHIKREDFFEVSHHDDFVKLLDKKYIDNPQEYIPIVFATNKNYCLPCIVAINSLIKNASPDRKYAVFVLHSELDDQNISDMENLSTSNVFVHCMQLDIKKLIGDSFDYTTAHYSKEMYYRILIPQLFGMYDKVVYLDCDIVLTDDVYNLYKTDIGDNVIAAVINPIVRSKDYVEQELHMNIEKYFNSGILIINNQEFKKQQIKEKCLSLLQEHKKLRFPDQDVLNMACKDKVHYLDVRWNWQWLFDLQNMKLPEYCAQDYKFNNPHIIHYASNIKPWLNPFVRYAHIWWKYAKGTPAYKLRSNFDYRQELEKWYEKVTGQKVNLDNPQTFNEKIQWSKLYDSTPIKTRLADKFLVRDWVADKIGEEYLIPLLGVYDSFDEIDFDKLPDQFVIKTNNASGTNIIVKDKSKLDLVTTKQKINRWMATNFAFIAGCELHYYNMVPKIIIEKYMDDGTGDLRDYKFTCFNGKPEFIWIDSDRHTEHKRNLYDLQWNQMNAKVNTKYDTFPSPEKPECLDKMIKLAKILSYGFNYVRVDFYVINNKVYFGEMTFTSSSGTEQIVPASFDKHLGKLFKLPKKAYDIDTGKYYKLPKQPKVKAQHKPVLIKPYLLFPYYLLSSFYLRHIKLPILKFNKHTKEVLYSHSARGRMDRILQSVQSVKDNMQNQINIVKAQQNDLIKQVNNNIATVKQNSEKQISGLSDNIKKVENSVLSVNNQTSETQELFDSKLAETQKLFESKASETQELFDSKVSETNDRLSEIQNEFMADIDTLSEQIDTKVSDLYKKIDKVSDNFKVISERLNDSEKTLSDKITNVVDAKHKELSNNITKTAAAQNTDAKRIENAVVDVKNQIQTFEKNSLNSVNNIVSKLDSNKQELNTNIEKDRILYFNPWSTAVNTERGNCDMTSAPDFENRFKKLIAGLSAESAETIVKIIRRLQLIKGTNSKLDLFTKEEKDLLQRVRDFNKEILKVSDNLYAYKNYLLPTNHFEASVFLYNHGIEKLNSVESFKDKDILDVGGFIGDSVLMLSPLTNKKIYSFEAMKENFDLMQKTIELNGIKNAVPVHAAVGDKPGEIEIRFNGSASSQNDIMVKDPKYIEKCQVIKMDDYVREHNINVGLIKVDIEGAEQSFLRGAKETICKYKPTLLISIYHNVDDFLDIKPMIESWNLGYKFKVFKPVIESVSGETLLICECN